MAIDEIGSLGGNLRQAATREGHWILWAMGVFVAIWGVVILVMVLSNRQSTPPVVSVPPPVVKPKPPPPPVVVPTSVPAPPPATVPVVTAPPPPKRPPIEIHITERKAALSDADIVAAIQKGIDFLLINLNSGELDENIAPNPTDRAGIDALAVYALLHCNQSTHDERIGINNPVMKTLIEHLKKFPMVATSEGGRPITYSRSLRASALAIYNRPEDREAIGNDLQWLLRAEQDGAYTYDDVFNRPGQKKPMTPPPGAHGPGDFSWDNSNSQYGLIGVWSCADAGLAVPNKYWEDVERHWLICQQPDGTWGYRQTDSSFSMTMAGITALSVCRDYMHDSVLEPMSALRTTQRKNALDKAMTWFEIGDHSVNVQGSWYSYSLYGLERAALASGMLFAGTHDVYRELATQVVQNQKANGAWREDSGRDAIIDTSFSLLFLSRGRNPVIVNKLRYDGNWENHPRDVANLARYTGYALERPLNWQVAMLTEPWAAWMEAPILYIAGDTPPEFGPADYERLKSYVDNGGLIFTQSDNGSQAFTEFAKNLAAQLYPQYPMSEVKDDDELYTIQFDIPAPRPTMLAVSNGSRKLMVHCTQDLAKVWQANNPKRDRAAFNLALNLLIYATGKSDLRTKMDSPYIPPPTDGAGQHIPVARVQYSGNWDPEPAAWPRFARYAWWQTGLLFDPTPVQAADLKFSQYPVACLTGTAAETPDNATTHGLFQFVQDGGVLFIDCCGGSKDFDDSVRKYWLPIICPDGALNVVPDDDPILTGIIPHLDSSSLELPKFQLRPYAIQVSKPHNTRLLEIKSGKGRVLFSEMDVTTGLLGTSTWGITGYTPAYGQALLKNVILSAVTKDQ